MTESEIRLRCLELALSQAKVQGEAQNLNVVAEIATRFYNFVTGAPSQAPQGEAKGIRSGKAPRAKKADKASILD